MTEENRRDFMEEMRQDAMEEKYREEREATQEYKLSEDYDYFVYNFRHEFNEAYSSLRELKRLHKMYGHTFDIKELGDELWLNQKDVENG